MFQASSNSISFLLVDVLYPLPDGWPKIPEIFVRRSWDFSTATCPVINKATAHLELLQNIIEDWSLQAKNEILSRASSRATEIASSRGAAATSDAGTTTTGRRQIRFTPSAISSLRTGSRQPSAHADSVITQRTTTDLSIQGIGADFGSSYFIITKCLIINNFVHVSSFYK